MSKPKVRIVTPALPPAHNGNAHTAARWQQFLAPLAEVELALDWQGEPADALIALHARRSAGAVARFHAAHPDRALALVLTGTDLYRDLDSDDASARHSVQCASHLVVLQEESMNRLDAQARAKARVIVQSAASVLNDGPCAADAPFVAVGHLREEKDPLTLMRAVAALPADSAIGIVHIGRALDDALAQAARQTMAAHPGRYRWLGGLDPDITRRWIAGARALVHPSRMEGGANAVIEAVRSRVPVLASRIDGNVGLLGRDYAGYFTVGDAFALAALMQRFVDDPAFAGQLAAQCAAREPLFTPAAERAALAGLLRDMLAWRNHPATISSSSSSTAS